MLRNRGLQPTANISWLTLPTVRAGHFAEPVKLMTTTSANLLTLYNLKEKRKKPELELSGYVLLDA